MLGGLLVLSALWLRRGSGSYLTTLMLVLLSCFATVRYAHLACAFGGALLPGSATWSGLDAFFVVVVLGAEVYAFVALITPDSMAAAAHAGSAAGGTRRRGRLRSIC